MKKSTAFQLSRHVELRTYMQRFDIYAKKVAAFGLSPPPIQPDLQLFVERRGGGKLLARAVRQAEQGNYAGAEAILSKARRIIQPNASDFPIEPGTKVAVIRCRHGWYDGSVEGVVTSRNGNSYIVKTDDGHYLDINHTRDLRKIG